MNNPLALTDPSGYFSLRKLVRVAVAIAVAVYAPQISAYVGWTSGVSASGAAIVGAGSGAAAVGITSGAVASGMLGGALSGAIMSGTLKGAVIGGLTGAAFGAVGDKFSGWANVAGHAAVGCASSVASGGGCQSGALSGAAGSMFSQFGPKFDSFAANLVAHSVAGGVASVIGGGKFENGATTAAFGYLFNCGAHDCWNKAKEVPVSNAAKSAISSGPEAIDQVIGVGPVDAYTAKQIAGEALQSAQDSGLRGLHNGPADAVRHCTWSCSMAQALGTDQAKLVGDIHELKGNSGYGGNAPQPRGEFIMDTWNNEIGRTLAPTSNVCLAACTGAFSAGKLKGLNGKPF